MTKKNKVALVSGITGQDGAYLAKLLLDKGYIVHGIKRRASQNNTDRVDPIYNNQDLKSRFHLHYGDLSDSSSIIKILAQIEPDEIYNLGAQSHVRVSFDCPEYTAQVDALGTLRFLDAINFLKLNNKTKFYQASTSELYGKVQQIPQTEETPFYPRSPYAVAKLYALWISRNYREAYNIFACNGILFNHESPLRGETFVTRKITQAAAKISLGLQDKLYLGNLDAKRDWGHAKDYVKGMWKMLQTEKADDYVLATNTTTTVKDFARMAFSYAGVNIEFHGKDENEYAVNTATGSKIIEINPRYYRPTEVDLLIGDSSKAKSELNWQADIKLDELCKEMVCADMYRLKCKLHIDNFSNSLPSVENIVLNHGSILSYLDEKPSLKVAA